MQNWIKRFFGKPRRETSKPGETQASHRTGTRLPGEGKLPEHTLVLAGKPGRASAEVSRLVQSGGNNVKALGYVEREALPGLLGGAEAFVFLSLYEGFGMPVAEALACGTRVVTTDSPELREAGGEQCIFIEPIEERIRHGIEVACSMNSAPSSSPPRSTKNDNAAILAGEIHRLLGVNSPSWNPCHHGGDQEFFGGRPMWTATSPNSPRHDKTSQTSAGSMICR